MSPSESASPLDLTQRGPRLLGGGAGSRTRGVALSTASTVVVVAVVAALFLLAPGSAQVRHTFFSPADLWQSLIGDPAKGYYSVGAAIWLNIRMFLVAEVFILVLGLLLAIVKQSTGPVMLPLRVVALVYVDIFRGIPTILVIYAVGFGLPALNLTGVSQQAPPSTGSSRSCCRTPPTCARSTGPESTPSRWPRPARPGPSGSARRRRCGT